MFKSNLLEIERFWDTGIYS